MSHSVERVFQREISRRGFLKGAISAICFSIFHPFKRSSNLSASQANPLFWVRNIPDEPFYGKGNGNYHAGVDSLLRLMGTHGLKFFRSTEESLLSGPLGMIAPDDIVLVKVNAQWKYRGCTNSDLIRGLVQRILDHPNGFNGEVVIFENGQSQGSLNGDALGWGSYPDNSIHANANDESHSFLYLANTVFNDPRVSGFLLDPIRTTLIGATNHTTNGYRTFENVSYPCFTTAGGRRVELKEGIWNGNSYSQNLKLINVPVLKVHSGSEITASLKHFYGVVSMADGVDSGRHYTQLGNTCGKMVVSVRTPVLNIIDAIWVSHGFLSGYPASTTFRANQILASQDPVALDYWATKYILYPKTKLSNHLPTYSGIDQWLTQARDMINTRGGLYNPDSGIMVSSVTKDEQQMLPHLFTFSCGFADYDGDGITDVSGFYAPSGWFFTDYDGSLGQYGWGDSMPLVWDHNGNGKTDISIYHIPTNQWFVKGAPGDSLGQFGWGGDESIPVPGDYNGDGIMERAFYHWPTNRWFIEWPDHSVTSYDFGWNGAECIPVPGDYDGNGTTVMMLYHIPSNQWFRYDQGNLGQYGWGGADCIPVPGDYLGNGKTQIAVYHVPTNQWFVKGYPGDNLGQYGWGGLQSFPVPGDYDGDGTWEIGFYRPSENRWFIEGESDFIWGWDTSNFMPITSQMAIFNWFRFVLGRFQ